MAFPGTLAFLLFLVLQLRAGSAFELLHIGPSRTGTQTLYVAVKTLGLNPIHAGFNHSVVRQPICEYLFGGGPRDAAMQIFDKWDACMDEPCNFMYEDVLADYPNAKFLLPAIDVEAWYESFKHWFEDMWFYKFKEDVANVAKRTLKIKRSITYAVMDAGTDWWMQQQFTTDHCWASRAWGCRFDKHEGMTAEENATCKGNFTAFYKKAKAIIPPERLLIFNYSDGWGPLCKFLGKPIPDEPFPFADAFHREEAEASSSFLQSDLQLHPRVEL
mmetsp:Transcript_55094/g.103296  ORF Transcript_55094/g.103296 Transcript_55094/m.103296 type:complete len:273 (-) Transcript_55094:49-867(-)